MKKVFITGASGYVGSAVAQYFRDHGWEVVADRSWRLGMVPPSDLFKAVDAVVHCAYDFRAATWKEISERNVAGAVSLFESARKAGVEKLIFVSSLSAFDGCRSMYGKAKLEAEKQLLPTGVAVVRPGLVYGRKPFGMFGKLLGLVQKLPLIPVIGGGNQPMYLIHQDDLAAFLFALASGYVKNLETPFILAHPEPKRFKDILSTIAESVGKNARFISVPAWPIFGALKLVESFGVRLRVRSDSLVGLLNPDPQPDFSSTIKTGLPIRPFSVAEILQVPS